MSAVNELEIKSKSLQQAVVPAFLTARRADNKDIRIFLFVCSIKNAKLSLIRLALAVAAEIDAVAEAVQLFGNAEVKGIEVEAVGGYPFYFICVHITILSAQADCKTPFACRFIRIYNISTYIIHFFKI